MELPNATVIDYLIDGRNRRIGKKVNASVVKRSSIAVVNWMQRF